MASYYAFLVLVFHLGGVFIHQEGFTGKIYEIDERTFVQVSLYAATFNALFLVVLSVGARPFELAQRLTDIDMGLVTNVYFGLFVIGAVLYFFESSSFDYAGYVSFRGVAYGWVLLIVGTSSLVTAYLRRSYLYLATVLLVYAYFCFKTGVRSFLQMPLLPLAILSLANSDRDLGKKLALYGGVLLTAAFALLFLRSSGELALPEIFLVHGLHVVFYSYSGNDQHTVSPLIGFAIGFVNFFAKIDLDSLDPAIRFAQDFFGFTTPDGFYHMPFTWYADSFAAHGYMGVAYGAVWAVLIRGLKWLVLRDPLTLAAFLPQVCWVCFFVIRGAAVNATNSITTAIWLSIAVYGFLRIASVGAMQRAR
ncbi:hypothetical protein AB4Y32_36090 [Paraburkholderia phymatum]|uniref:Uncharacterized protein n=1 Tax=Paraburkholderia phymatum TaxID=148447 RepID=A0ACC6UBU9_9BURK